MMDASDSPTRDEAGRAVSGHEGTAASDAPIPFGVLDKVFSVEPGVGIAIVDEFGMIHYVNAKTAEVFAKITPDEAIGMTMAELFDKEWTDERLRLFQQIKRTGRPVIIRSIRLGQRIQSTMRLLDKRPIEGDPDGKTVALILIITVEGEHDPSEPDQYDIVEAETASFGELDPLTPREIEVLALIGLGLTAQQIAKSLHRSPRTVERHTDSIRAKLGKTNRVQLADFARRAGLRVEDASLLRQSR